MLLLKVSFSKTTIMKYFCLFILLMSNTVVTSAQTIKGKIVNVFDGKLLFTYSYDQQYSQTDTILLKPDGSFEKRFHFKGIGRVYLTTSEANATLTVFPSSALTIVANGETRKTFDETISITGKGSEICTEVFVFKDEKLKDIQWDYGLSADSFVTRLTYWKDLKNTLTRKLVQQRRVVAGLTPAELSLFYKVDSLNNLYWITGAFRDYHTQKLHMSSTEDSFFKQNIAPHAVLKDDADYMVVDQYRSFWYRYTLYQYEWALKTKDSTLLKKKGMIGGWLEEMQKGTKGKLQQAVLSDFLLGEFPFVYEYFPEKDFPVYDSLLQVFGKIPTNPAVFKRAQQLASIKKERRMLTAKGKAAPDFMLADSVGKQYALKDFAGKIIYLDVWASWCRPCVGEIPDYKKLVEKFKRQENVVFLSASIDNTKEDWIEKGLRKHNPPGLQLWVGKGGWNSEFVKTYYVSGVPLYVIIDKQGKIFNFNAPRPSSGAEIETALSEALQN
jgi:thiol-disulfide isomerase/thioredoxin